MAYSPWGCKELDMSEFHFFQIRKLSSKDLQHLFKKYQSISPPVAGAKGWLLLWLVMAQPSSPSDALTTVCQLP